MTPREWFECVLGWEYNPKTHSFERPVDEPGGKEQIMLPAEFLLETESHWIEHVVYPMQEMGYFYEIGTLWEKQGVFSYFSWVHYKDGEQASCVSEVRIFNSHIIDASLHAAQFVPEVRKRLEKWRRDGQVI